MMASPPTRPALRERYDRRRDDVVAGAAAVFARRGYGRTSVQELAGELGLATGALYHYFPGKEELVVSICDQLMDPLLERATEILAADADPARRLRELIAVWVEHVTTHRDHLLVFQQVRHLVDHGAHWRGVRASRKAFEDLLGRAIRDAYDPSPAAHPDPDLALYALLGMVNHTVQWYRPRGRLSPAEIADGYAGLVLGGAAVAR
jgi:TetR/AcrR family transcriptional regulator, cholesterol catabolism regulator